MENIISGLFAIAALVGIGLLARHEMRRVMREIDDILSDRRNP